jgi:hypothetical protein
MPAWQAFVVRHLVGGHDLAETARAHADRLFHEHMFAGLDRSSVLLRAESGRTGDDDHVHPGINRLLIRIQTRKHPLANVHHVLEFSRRLAVLDPPLDSAGDFVNRAFAPILERIGHSDDFDGWCMRPPQPITATRSRSLPAACTIQEEGA